MRLKFFKVDNDGNVKGEVEAGWIDGYAVAETQLEGVMFRCAPSMSGDDLLVTVDAGSADYFRNFNEKKWLKEVREYALTTDVFSSSATANDDAVSLYDFDKPLEQQAANWYDIPS